MPRIIDYPVVLDRMLAAGLESLYHNSGAFGFARAVPTQNVGWIGPPDPTLRAGALALTRQVAEPFAPTLAALAVRAWRDHLPGPAWLMPKSHWAFELDHANGDWMAPLMRELGLDPEALASRNDAAALEFLQPEEQLLSAALEQLLTRLWGSDFALAWPGRPVVCMIHHHTQLWWTTSDAGLADAVRAMVPMSPRQ